LAKVFFKIIILLINNNVKKANIKNLNKNRLSLNHNLTEIVKKDINHLNKNVFLTAVLFL